ncbi:hypothetical protein ACFQ0G_11760 [Streptomyces chiangmaiensis]
MQQALPTTILALVQQSQPGQQLWGGGFGQPQFGQQPFGQPYPQQQYQQPGFGFGQIGQPFGIG